MLWGFAPPKQARAAPALDTAYAGARAGAGGATMPLCACAGCSVLTHRERVELTTGLRGDKDYVATKVGVREAWARAKGVVATRAACNAGGSAGGSAERAHRGGKGVRMRRRSLRC